MGLITPLLNYSMDLRKIHPFESAHVPPRNVDIWLPPDYDAAPDRRHPVVYMHDGQNLFDPALSFSGVDWGIDPALSRLLDEGAIPAPIIVGIWNTDNRLGEYMPEEPLQDPDLRQQVDSFLKKHRGQFKFDPIGDRYLRFIIEELKPWVDAGFRTRPEQPHTHLIGSSMGALISLYALCQAPEVFCGAGCLSPAWNFDRGTLMNYFGAHLPDPTAHRLYFDMGGREEFWPRANKSLLRWQAEMDEHARQRGYRDRENLLSLVFPKHRHHESAWRERVERALEFLIC